MSSKDNVKQTLTGIIRERIELIESRLEVGERQEMIVAELQAEGYPTTLASFRNLLSKARAWREQKRAAKVAVGIDTGLPVIREIRKPLKPGIQPTGAIRNPGNFDKKELF